MSASQPTTFRNDDAGFRRWRRTHPNGYVFNFFGGSDPRDNVLHRSGCDSLSPPLGNMAWTSVPKVCGDDRTALEEHIDRLRGGRDRWTACDNCFRWGGA